MGRILALDYGEKRVGLAWTDTLRLSINPLPTIPARELFDHLDQRLKDGKVTDIVIGSPRHIDGSTNHLQKGIVRIRKFLRQNYSSIQIHFVDEAFTSKDAREVLVTLGTSKKHRRTKENIDQMSAVLILKEHLQRTQ